MAFPYFMGCDTEPTDVANNTAGNTTYVWAEACPDGGDGDVGGRRLGERLSPADDFQIVEGVTAVARTDDKPVYREYQPA